MAFALSVGSAGAAEPLKVGFIYVGPISDHGYTYQHELGRRDVERVFGDKVVTSFVENVAEGADAERVIDQLAANGNTLIFTTSFGFMNPTLRVAQRYPDFKFEHATGYKRSTNLATYSARFYEGRYVVGLIAGHLTKSNIIGYIGSHPIPEVYQGINAFTIALRRVNPKAEVRVIWVNSWYDPAREAEAAKALMDQGADVILQHTDSPAPMQAAAERGVWAVGQSSDMTRFGPDNHITSIVDDWGPYYVERVQAVLDGTWAPTDVWGGFAAAMLHLAPFNPKIGPDLIVLGNATQKAIEDGTLHPFQGPFNNQDGQPVVADGQTLTDEQILRMDYYVEGVQGRPPR